jgi:hypothetical protein
MEMPKGKKYFIEARGRGRCDGKSYKRAEPAYEAYFAAKDTAKTMATAKAKQFCEVRMFGANQAWQVYEDGSMRRLFY